MIDTDAATKRHGPSGDRAWHKSRRIVSTVIFDTESQVVGPALQADRGMGGLGMAPDVAQSFGDDLKHLGGQAVMELEIRGDIERHRDPRGIGKLVRESPHRGQQAARGRALAGQLAREPTEIRNPGIGKRDQPIKIRRHVAPPRR